MSGLTLIELLVSISIIGILIALLLPAVQAAREAAREAARQVQCRKSLKQLALACHHYESVFRVFPGYAGERAPALVSMPLRQREPTMRGGNWITKALPYMEQGKLARQWELLGSVPADSLPLQDRLGIDAVIDELHCPSRRTAEAYPLVGTYQQRFGNFATRSDYAMNGGPAEVISSNTIEVKDDGVWRLGRYTGFQHLKDGSSNTYLIGEKSMNSDKYQTGTDFGDRGPAMGWVDNNTATNSIVRFAARPTVKDHVGSCTACHDFGSAHPGVWNAALGDGSVRSIAYEIDLRVHRANASIDGGEWPGGATQCDTSPIPNREHNADQS